MSDAAGPRPGDDGDPVAGVERLAAVTAARLRLSAPPLGDGGPAGLGALLLATAVALRHVPEVAGMALDVSAPDSAADLLARHGLVRRVRSCGDPALAPDDRLGDELLRHSPLTGLLSAPATTPGAEAAAEQVLDRLLGHPEGRTTVTTALAPPPTGPRTARWRARLLERRRYTAEERRWVLDVYETALLHHGPELRRRTAHATVVLAGVGPVPPGPDERDTGAGRVVDEAEALAEWWRPLAVLTHRHGTELRARPLLEGYDDALELCRIHRGVLARTELTRLAAR
ncbi:hypothetical protein [Streptomyces griseus]|uniref:hypothetical protein n=1 Tax=Streptomyces griseus TaxID=1911 RepID=UPI00055D1472|nr:hypothetical protein [Streptomyces griseus]